MKINVYSHNVVIDKPWFPFYNLTSDFVYQNNICRPLDCDIVMISCYRTVTMTTVERAQMEYWCKQDNIPVFVFGEANNILRDGWKHLDSRDYYIDEYQLIILSEFEGFSFKDHIKQLAHEQHKKMLNAYVLDRYEMITVPKICPKMLILDI